MMFTLRTARVSGNTIFQCIWEGSATWAGPSELFHLITSVTVTKRLEYFCNILFLLSYSVISNSLWHYGLSASSVAQSGPTFCKPINRSMPGLLVHHQLLNTWPSSQWCHPTISSSDISSPPAFNLSQHQSLFQWISSLYQVARVLEFQLQHQSFQWIFRTDFL